MNTKQAPGGFVEGYIRGKQYEIVRILELIDEEIFRMNFLEAKTMVSILKRFRSDVESGKLASTSVLELNHDCL